MLLALGMVILGGRSRSLSQFLLDPPVLCLLLLLLLALIHLVVDLPRHGLYALRDSSIFCEAVFLPLGLLWANRKRDTPLLLKWLLLVFFTNLIYSFTFPWAEQLQSWSCLSPSSVSGCEGGVGRWTSRFLRSTCEPFCP